jgi:5'-3' exoribonuclease 2
MYGADADLIMLGLSTHELNFAIIRETIEVKSQKKCLNCGKNGHVDIECDVKDKTHSGTIKLAKSVKFQFVKINIVREYLYLEFKDIHLPFPYDFERIIDDFVFLCFFVGNDFLPHLPSLHIGEGALDALMVIYKNLLPSLGDYLTNNGVIDFTKVDVIFNDIAKIEEEFFKIKKAQEEKNKLYNANGGRGGRGGFRGRGRGGS